LRAGGSTPGQAAEPVPEADRAVRTGADRRGPSVGLSRPAPGAEGGSTSHLTGRPIIILVLTIIIDLQALAFVAEAVGFATWLSPHNLVSSGLRDLGVPAAIAALFAAGLLTRRAYLLYTYHRGAWAVTLLLLLVQAVASLLFILGTGQVLPSLLSLILPIAGIALLLSPDVRQWYRPHPTGG
jgi:hypothetical protein